MRVVGLILSVFMLGLSVACNGAHDNSCSEYHRIRHDAWKFGEAVWFRPEHPDSVCRGRFVVALRHDGSYPYTALRLEVSYESGRNPDTIDIRVADSYGKWLGRGIGTSFQLADTLPPVAHESGAWIKVRHLMRADTLRGVSQVGLFFVPSEK